MTKKQLIERLQKYNDDKIVTLNILEGWHNIWKITETKNTIDIHADVHTIFSDD